MRYASYMKPRDDTNYIIEFRRIGSYVRVSAMDPVSLTEVAIMGASSAPESELTRIAVQKLEYVMAKKGQV
jgi:hypothetical protein